MLFVLLFIAAMLIVPMLLDLKRYRGANIFLRSGAGLAERAATLPGRPVVAAARRLNPALIGAISLVVLVFVIVLAVQLAAVLGVLISALFR